MRRTEQRSGRTVPDATMDEVARLCRERYAGSLLTRRIQLALPAGGKMLQSPSGWPAPAVAAWLLLVARTRRHSE